MLFSSFPLRVPITVAGVSPRDLIHQSSVHNPGHINRVIFHAMVLARISGFQEFVPAAWAAAHLHDLCRFGDGRCELHGQRAVTMRLRQYFELYRAGGVRTEDLPAICTAVAAHCVDDELPISHPHYVLTAILKDADALDRVRIGALDVSALRLPRSQTFVPIAKGLFTCTHAASSLEEVWQAGTQIIAPPPGLLERHPYHWSELESGRDRRDRRLRMAAERPNAVVPLPQVWHPSVSADTAIHWCFDQAIRSNSRLSVGCSRLLPDLARIIRALRAAAQRLVPVTASNHARAFFENGVYLGMWEAKPSWHYRYLDDPETGRLIHALRIFGERDAYVTYGILVDPRSEHLETQLTELRKTYSNQLIFWDPEILTSASFTMNDSMQQPCALPFSPENWIKAHLLSNAAAFAGTAWPAQIMPYADEKLHFWEFQIHRKLTPEDVVRTDPAITTDENRARPIAA